MKECSREPMISTSSAGSVCMGVNVDVKTAIAKRLAVLQQIMSPEMMYETSFQLTTESSQTLGSGDVAGKFIPQNVARDDGETELSSR